MATRLAGTDGLLCACLSLLSVAIHDVIELAQGLDSSNGGTVITGTDEPSVAGACGDREAGQAEARGGAGAEGEDGGVGASASEGGSPYMQSAGWDDGLDTALWRLGGERWACDPRVVALVGAAEGRVWVLGSEGSGGGVEGGSGGDSKGGSGGGAGAGGVAIEVGVCPREEGLVSVLSRFVEWCDEEWDEELTWEVADCGESVSMYSHYNTVLPSTCNYSIRAPQLEHRLLRQSSIHSCNM